MAPCPPLPDLEGNSVDTVLALLIEVAGMYHECAAGKADLARAANLRA